MKLRFVSVLSFVAGILLCFGAVIVLLNGFGSAVVITAVSALVLLFSGVCFLLQYFFAKGEQFRGAWSIWMIVLYTATAILLFGCLSSPLLRTADLAAAFSVFSGLNRISAFYQLRKIEKKPNWIALLFGILCGLAGGVFYFLPSPSGYLLNLFLALFFILECAYASLLWLQNEKSASRGL